eukprot:2021862-Pyramimonas_sp.AAC.1
MEEHDCHCLAIHEWPERNRQDREQLRAASAHMQQIISDAQVNKKTAEEAQRQLAVSEAERQAIARRMEHEKTIS